MAGNKRSGKPKRKVVSKGQKEGAKNAGQQSQPPIHLPTDALAEVFKYLPRAHRAQLALVSSQTAEAIIPGVRAEHQKVLATAQSIVDAYESQLGELMQQCLALSTQLGPMRDECEAELGRLHHSMPPFLVVCHRGPLNPAHKPLMREISALHSRAEAIRGRQIMLVTALDKLADLMDLAAAGGLTRAQALQHEIKQFETHAELSLLFAEQYECFVAIRRAEVQLREREVRFILPEERAATHYQAVLSADPQLAALCADCTRLAERYREKHSMELEMRELYRQALAIDVKIMGVVAEHERIEMAEKRVPMDG